LIHKFFVGYSSYSIP